MQSPGFFDGINEVWSTVTRELVRDAWRGHVYDTIAKMKWSKRVTERRGRLLLGMSPVKLYDMDYIEFKLAKILRENNKVSAQTINRDIKSLIDAKLLVMDSKTKQISANKAILLGKYPRSRR